MRSYSCILRTPSAIRSYNVSSLSCPKFAGNVSRALPVSRTVPVSSRLFTLSSNLYSTRALHRQYSNRYSTHRTRWKTGSVRWNSSTDQGGGASGGGGGAGGGGGGGKGFFQNFFDNLKKGVEKNQEMQESLKGFHEEREKLQQSYVAQQVKLKFAAAIEKLGAVGRKGAERWRLFKDTSSKVLPF